MECDNAQILSVVNSEFTFSEIGCLTKAKEPGLPYSVPIAGVAGEQIDSFFSKGH